MSRSMTHRPFVIAGCQSLLMALLMALLMVLLMACVADEPEPDPDPEPVPGLLEIGTAIGEDGSGFAAIDDGTEVPLTAGIQGGFHIWLNVKVSGIAGEYYLEWDARRVVDDELVSRAIPQYIDVADDAMTDWWENPRGMPSFMCPTPIGIKVYDEELYFDLRIVDEDDQVMARDTLFVVARCPQGMHADFCRDICSGEPG